MKEKSNEIVIALGGSIICPKEIDSNYLRQFYLSIKKEIKKGSKFIIITGGGDIARNYQKSAQLINRVPNRERDWIGIYATYLNAHLLKAVFKKEAHPSIFNDRFKVKDFNGYSVIIGSGWSPGWSTDFVATQIAVDLKIEKIIILGKPDYVYTKDPNKNKDAKKIEEIKWDDYLKMIPSRWRPGMSMPVDPVAARLAKKEKREVIVADGKNILNFRKILRNKKFNGSRIYF
jgi:uridylate kinase